MHDPLIQYLVGTCILSVGIAILLSAPDIAQGLSRLWERLLGKKDDSGTSSHSDQPLSYRARLIIWRAIGIIILVEGFIWLALATAGVFHLVPRNKP